ncbi:MAG: alcohol acetyltransferase [Eggerthellaceae bacterium]|nr:alcohol acetyltransferase [Eggerthellaceae bacterium]
MDKTAWYRLDNIGKFYASQAGSPTQTVFRYSATMDEPVDAADLQCALDRALEVYPSFNVRLRSGLFWHYLEQSRDAPSVSEESAPICHGLHVNEKSVLFRVSYYGKRINLEISHIISDGRGTLDFFKALVIAYTQKHYGHPESSIAPFSTDEQKLENSFDAHYEKGLAGSTRKPRVFHLEGTKNVLSPVYLEYHTSAARALSLARGIGASLTSLIIAAVICAIRSQMRTRERNKAIRLDIPVDLRRFFGSSTTKNFFGLAFVEYKPGIDDEPIDAVAKEVQRQMRAGTSLENLKRRMNHMIALEKNPFLRFAPVFIKDQALKIAGRVTEGDVTATVSSLGVIEFPEYASSRIENVNVLTSPAGMNFTICTCKDDLSLGFSTSFTDLSVMRNLCRIFKDLGIEGSINISKEEDDDEM